MIEKDYNPVEQIILNRQEVSDTEGDRVERMKADARALSQMFAATGDAGCHNLIALFASKQEIWTSARYTRQMRSQGDTENRPSE